MDATGQQAADDLLGVLEQVTRADGRRYAVTDDTGRPMHTAKIVQEPGGGYLAVYHSVLGDGLFHTALAASSDLVNWTFAAELAVGASQPTLAPAPGGGYVAAWEQEPHNHIAVCFYPDRAALLAARPTRRFDAPRTLSRHAEGTPNIYSVRTGPDIDSCVVDLGAHYWWRRRQDRQMRALLVGFRSWHPAPCPRLDAAVLRWGVDGNIGGRDAVRVRGRRLTVLEGQQVAHDFGSWRVFVYDEADECARPARIRTDAGSRAFANPKVTALTAPDGRPALAVSLFLPAEGAAGGEGGQLIYHRSC